MPVASSIRASDRMVLAYRLRRPVAGQVAPVPGMPYLVPAAARLEHWCNGSTLLAESGEGTYDFALMRIAVPAVAARRTTGLCNEPPARVGGAPRRSAQKMAGSPRVLIPFGDPLPRPTP